MIIQLPPELQVRATEEDYETIELPVLPELPGAENRAQRRAAARKMRNRGKRKTR